MLKIDIETLEREILLSIPASVLRKIKKIYIEQRFQSPPLQSSHSFRQYGPVAQFLRYAKDSNDAPLPDSASLLQPRVARR